MSFIEKKVITYSKSTIFIQAMHKLFVQYSGYQVHFESRFKKELKKLLGGIFAKIVLKRTFPYVFYTTPFKWWVILPVLNSFRKKNEIGNIICSQQKIQVVHVIDFNRHYLTCTNHAYIIHYIITLDTRYLLKTGYRLKFNSVQKCSVHQ